MQLTWSFVRAATLFKMENGACGNRHFASTKDIGWFSGALYSMSAWIVHFAYNTITAILPEPHKRKSDAIMRELMDEDENSCFAEGGELIPEIQMKTSKSVRLVTMVVDSVIFAAVCIFLMLCIYASLAYL